MKKIQTERERVKKNLKKMKETTEEIHELESKMSNLKIKYREKEQNYNEEISKITNKLRARRALMTHKSGII